MASYQIEPVCPKKDAIPLSKNNMSAFWEQTWYRMLHVDRTLESIIDSSILRIPKNLLTDRAVRRHQKVIDSATGGTVGYARWILPESHSGSWLEAQVPSVTEEESKEFEANYKRAVWSPREDMPGFDDPLDEMMKKHAPKKPHISEYNPIR